MMKKMVTQLVSVVAGLLLAAVAFAQTYPYSTPTYIPNAIFPAFTIASNVPSAAMTLNGIGTVTLQISGTCTSLAGAAVQGSIDGTNYTTLNMYPNTATAAASAVAAVTTTGVWNVNAAGYKNIRLTNTGVGTTSCIGTLFGSSAAFTIPR